MKTDSQRIVAEREKAIEMLKVAFGGAQALVTDVSKESSWKYELHAHT